MLLARSLDPAYLSNAYLVGDHDGGSAVFVDSGAPIEPLLSFGREHRLRPTHVLRTHSHGDHVTHEGELGLPVVTGVLTTGTLEVEAIPTPGHCDDMVCFVVSDGSGAAGRAVSPRPDPRRRGS
jgi:glyoxylase-like metal-dependent hydrolase (beta-lactamase superfamily II)